MTHRDRERIEAHLVEIGKRTAAIGQILAETPAPPKQKKREGYIASREAQSLVAAWRKKQPGLPSNSQSQALYCQTLDDMHRLDRIDWPEITSIVRHAVEVWAPAGYIQSPSKLRRPSREYPEKRTWQVIRDQMHAGGGEPQLPDAVKRLL